MSVLFFTQGGRVPTRTEQADVRANFCNIACADGMPMFTDFLPKADEQGRFDEWKIGRAHV